MGPGTSEVNPARRLRAERQQRMTVIYAVMVSVMILIILQFLLLMVALEDFLAGGRALLGSAAVASGGCFAVSCWLVRYVSSRRAA